MFERHIFKFYKFNILFLIKIPASALPLCLIGVSWGRGCHSRQRTPRVQDSAPSSNHQLLLSSAERKNPSRSKSRMHRVVCVPCMTERRGDEKFTLGPFPCPAAVAWQTSFFTGFPLIRANAYQIRHIKTLIVPLGPARSLSESVRCPLKQQQK